MDHFLPGFLKNAFLAPILIEDAVVREDLLSVVDQDRVLEVLKIRAFLFGVFPKAWLDAHADLDVLRNVPFLALAVYHRKIIKKKENLKRSFPFNF